MSKRILLLGGTVSADTLDVARAKRFAGYLGAALAETELTIIYNGNKENLAAIAVEALMEAIGEANVKKRLITYIPRSRLKGDPYDNKPINRVGTMIIAGEWAEERRDRMVRDCDILISFSGRRGTFQCLSLAHMLGKLMVVVPQFGGSSQKFYESHYSELMTNENPELVSLMTSLNDIGLDEAQLAGHCIEIVDLILSEGGDDIQNPFAAEYERLHMISMSHRTGFSDILEEVERIKKTNDAVLILAATRRTLESVVTRLCKSCLKRDRGTEPMRSLIDQLNRGHHVPKDIIAHMKVVNDLGNMGAHPRKITDPNEVIKMSIMGLTIILEWLFQSPYE